MFNNGTVSKNTQFREICSKQIVNARVAYEASPWAMIEVANETNTMIEWLVYTVAGEYSQMPWDWEVLKPFLVHNNIEVTWIPCHTDGVYDEETGSWNGAVGKVTSYIVSN